MVRITFFALRTLKIEQRRYLQLSLGQALDRLVHASSRLTTLILRAYLPCSLQGVLPDYSVGYLIFGPASRLDAFSVYPIRT